MSDEKELNKNAEETESLSEKDLQQTTGGSGSLISGGVSEIKSGTLTEAQLAKAVGGAVDIFLKLDGVDGESQDTIHKNEIS